MTSRQFVAALVLLLAGISAIVFAGVAVHELNYASTHPYRYGPAKVIAWAAGAGAALALAVGLLGWASLRQDPTPHRRNEHVPRTHARNS